VSREYTGGKRRKEGGQTTKNEAKPVGWWKEKKGIWVGGQKKGQEKVLKPIRGN